MAVTSPIYRESRILLSLSKRPISFFHFHFCHLPFGIPTAPAHSPSSLCVVDDSPSPPQFALRRRLHRRQHALQWRNRHRHEAKRHFVHGAQLLAEARSSGDLSLARSAETDATVRLDPTDAASHILKAFALELLGFKTSTLGSIDAVLSPLAVKSLSDEERGDALYKRAKLKVGVSRMQKSDGGSSDPAVERDLREAVRLRPGNSRAWCLLGDCCEAMGETEKARDAFEAAIKAQPECKSAWEALERLGS